MLDLLRVRARRLARDDRGFSLTELLVVMIVSTLVLGAAIALYAIASNQNDRVANRSKSLGDAQVQLSRMTRELRQAYVVDPEVGVSGVDAMVTTNDAGLTDQHPVRYFCNTGAAGANGCARSWASCADALVKSWVLACPGSTAPSPWPNAAQWSLLAPYLHTTTLIETNVDSAVFSEPSPNYIFITLNMGISKPSRAGTSRPTNPIKLRDGAFARNTPTP